MNKRHLSFFVVAGALFLVAGTWAGLAAASRPVVDASALALLTESDAALKDMRSLSGEMETRWDQRRTLTRLRVLRPGYVRLSRRIETRTAPGAPWTSKPAADAVHYRNGKSEWTVLGHVGATQPAPISYVGWDIEPSLSGVYDNGLLCAAFDPFRAYTYWIAQLQDRERCGNSVLVGLRDAGRATVDGQPCRVVRLRVRDQVRTITFDNLKSGYVTPMNWSDRKPLWKSYDVTLYIGASDHLVRRETMVIELDGATVTREAVLRNVRVNPNLSPADFPASPPLAKRTTP